MNIYVTNILKPSKALIMRKNFLIIPSCVLARHKYFFKHLISQGIYIFQY